MPDIDLHTHTTASDGSVSPAGLVAMARKTGLTAIAITDHDTLDGIPEAVEAGTAEGVEVLPGVELSVDSSHGMMHIVGLWVQPEGSRLAATLDELQHYRNNRNQILIDKLQAIGVDITLDDVLAVAGDGSVGRPHFAQVLHAKGVVTSIQEAFDRYLGVGGRVYEPKRKLAPEQGIGLLKDAGATVILAHPYVLGLGKEELKTLLVSLKDMGLDGMEVYYTEHSPSKTRTFLELATALDLAVSGGSDYHGAPKPRISLGTGKGNLNIGYEVLQRIKDRRAAQGLPI